MGEKLFIIELIDQTRTYREDAGWAPIIQDGVFIMDNKEDEESIGWPLHRVLSFEYRTK